MPEVKAGDQITEFIPANFAEVHELGKAMAGPTLVPVGIVRAPDPAADKSFTQLFDVWITPEVARRMQAGRQAGLPSRCSRSSKPSLYFHRRVLQSGIESR
jgi:hypothetical protein